MNVSKWISNHASGILSLVACVGVAATAILTYKGTIKAQEIVKDKTVEKQDELTTMETIKASAKPLAPAAIAGVATIGCIVASHKIDEKHIAVLAASAAGMAKKYDDYRKTNIEVNGKEAHDKVMEKLAVQKAKQSNLSSESLCQITTLNSKLSKEQFLFHDNITDTYFKATLAQVLDAINCLNRNFTMGHPEVDVFMWCEFLGIENKKKDNRGWVLCDDYTWIDFDISDPVEIEDGVDVIEITPVVTPIEDYLNYDWMGDNIEDVLNDSEIPF